MLKLPKFRFSLLPQPPVELTEEGEKMWLTYHLNHAVECVGLGGFHMFAIIGYQTQLKDCFDRYHAGDLSGIVGLISLTVFMTTSIKWQLFDLIDRYQAGAKSILERYYYLPPNEYGMRDEYDPFGDE